MMTAHSRARSTRRRASLGTRLVSMLLISILWLGLAELLLRVVWMKRLTIPAGIEHAHFHHRLAPNSEQQFTSSEFNESTRTNAYGLRGPDPAVPKPAGTVRILLLGDSFTFGFPVQDDETFAARIQEGLRAQGLPVEVVNGGVSGYSPTLHYISLRDQYLAFEPDLVVLWYDLGDMQEDAWFQKNLVYDDAGRIVRCDPQYINGRYSRWEWLRNRSALVKYVDVKMFRTLHKIRVLGLRGYLGAKLRGERSKVAIARLKREQRAPDLASTDRFLLVREDATPEQIQPYWELTRGYLLRIRDLLAERGIPFVMGVYPYGMLAGPDQWNEGRAFWGFAPGRTYEATAALQLFHDFSREAQVPLLDTFPRFRDAARTEKLFYDQDGHMTPAGQRLVAEHALADPAFLALVRRLARR